MKMVGQVLEGVTVISVAEKMEIDISNAEEFKLAALEAIGGAGSVILDATLVDFFDSAGMASLLSIQKRQVEAGGSFALAGLAQPVLEIFNMIGFDIVFKTYADVPQAITAIRSKS